MGHSKNIVREGSSNFTYTRVLTCIDARGEGGSANLTHVLFTTYFNLFRKKHVFINNFKLIKQIKVSQDIFDFLRPCIIGTTSTKD